MADDTATGRPDRELLPTREQIELIADVDAVEDLLDRVDSQAKKIEVDLEFRPGDEDWAARARGALTAHNICIGHLWRHRGFLLRTRKVSRDAVAVNESKTARLQAATERSVVERDIHRLKAERERIERVKEGYAFARRQSWLAAFHRAACAELEFSVVQRLAGRAGDLLADNARGLIDATETPPP